MSTIHPKWGFRVWLFLPNGDPAGIKVIENSNWTGSGLVCESAGLARIPRISLGFHLRS